MTTELMTTALIKRGRGLLKRRADERTLAEEWATQQAEEKSLEDRHAG
jgi:hypothetical protein